MLKVGLTGGIGSGKTTVADLFKQHGAAVIDADEIAKDLTQPNTECYQAIVNYFGNTYTHTDGNLNRTQIRQAVFTDPIKRNWLEQLLHPKIIAQLTQQMESAHTPYCIAVVPLLIEAKLDALFDRILVVNTSEQHQLERAMNRDGSNKDTIAQIIQTQIHWTERLKHATDIIDNNEDLSNLKQKVDKLNELYLKLSQATA